MNWFKSLLITAFSCCFFSAGPLSATVYDYTYNNNVILLEDARAAVALKMDMVKKARHHIHIMSFYWDNNGFPIELMDELNKAHARGVDVRIMTSYIPTLTMDFFAVSKRALYKGTDKKSKTVVAYLKLVPGNKQDFTNNIHEKIFLVDGEKAILGGRNISDNDFRAKDLEVLLVGEVVNQVQKHFEKMFSFLIRLKIKDKCFDRSKKCAEKFNMAKFSEQDSGFYPEQPSFSGGLKARILTNEILLQQDEFNYWGEERFYAKDDIIDTIINTDFTRLRAYIYFIIPIKRFKLYLEQKLSEGKKIETITNSRVTAASISDAGYLFGLPEMLNLTKRGMDIYQWLGSEPEPGKDHLHYLHEKVMLFDEDHAIVGSHNFGAGSTSVSSEIAVEFYSKPVTQRLIEVFDAEKENTIKTTKSSVPSLEKEIVENRFMIRILHAFFIKNIIRELY